MEIKYNFIFFRDRFRYLMDKEGTVQKSLHLATGISESQISRWLSEDRKRIKRDNAKKLVSYFGCDLLWIEKNQGEPYPSPKSSNSELKELPSDIVELRRIPVLGNVPAGIPESIEEHIEEYILVPDAPPNSYALKVSGESMEPGIRHGDYIFFVIDREAKSGDVVVVNDEFGDSMIKRYKVKGDEQRLVSDNPAYPTYIPNNHYRIMGVVVGAMRKWKI